MLGKNPASQGSFAHARSWQVAGILVLELMGFLSCPADSEQTAVVWSEYFEAAGLPSGWSTTGGIWQVVSPAPTSGPGGALQGEQCAAIGLPGPNSTGLVAVLTRETLFQVPGAEQKPQLEFFHYYDNPGGTASVQLSGNGTNWTTLRQFTNAVPFWQEEFIDLSAYEKTSALIRFVFDSPASASSAAWYLDEMALVRELSRLGPTIVETPLTKTVAVGESVVFQVVADGTAPLSFQWRLNGANIDGQTNFTFTITNVQPQDCGNYTVVVANTVGVVISEVARLIVPVEPLPFVDRFDQSQIVRDSRRIGQGNNMQATLDLDPGEPLPGGKTGGHSVWLTWRPQKSGVATFSTRGSDFDTVLAVYTGSGL